VLSKLPSIEGAGDLLVGHGSNDDAAVMRIEGDLAIVQTVDFFTPIVDDPFLFGAIAAANSVSDIYAMGAKPILGLAIAAFPTDKLPLETLSRILEGGASKAAEAGFPIAGGHTIIDDVPKYGVAVTGTVRVDRIVRNSTGKPGDVLYLTKPIGNGILVSAWRGSGSWFSKRNRPSLDDAIEWMLRLNRDAAAVMVEVGASAATDITGYGFIGHLLEMCRGSAAGAEIEASAVPLLAGTRDFLARGFKPAGTMRNVDTFRPHVQLSVPDDEFTLLCDAQTSGGLLIAIPAERATQFEGRMREGGLFYAKVGSLNDNRGAVSVRP
jgi:selenide, water dikinase